MTENDAIVLKGVRVHNLKNQDIDIPLNKLVVVTGLSGSGKSSLAFDTVFAEGQRRYVESLSSYARQFMGRMNKPEADYIGGIPPAIAIRQNVGSRNSRSTVGTISEVYEYLKLLYARIGKTYSPISGEIVKNHTVSDVTDYFKSLKEGSRVYICFDSNLKNNSIENHLQFLAQQGYSRLIFDNKVFRFDDFFLENNKFTDNSIKIVLDRLTVKTDNQSLSRLADSVQTAFFEGNGSCCVIIDDNDKLTEKYFSIRFEADGMSFEMPTENMFAFNNPLGACPTCEGFGQTIGIDPDLVVPNKSLSVYNEAVVRWRGEKMSEWKDAFIRKAHKYNFPIHKPYFELSQEQIDLLWNGNHEIYGINHFFAMLEEQTYKIQYRTMLARYRGKTLCPDCKGTRLKKETSYVKIANKSIKELVNVPISELLLFFQNIKLSDYEQNIAERILTELITRLEFLRDVGLHYLSINRNANTLSGGEMQRIHLATALGSSLVGSLYILDEPSIGLHPRDTHLLLKVLKQLRDLQNTVLVVEHEEEIIKNADYLIDIGPGAGHLGGEIVFKGTFSELKKANTLTGEYISGRKTVKLDHHKKISKNYIEIIGARHNNLKNINVKFPLGAISVITGVSGSGKTSLVRDILFPALKKTLGISNPKSGEYTSINGNLSMVYDVEYVDQNPIARSSRSNPATYIKAYDEIRKLFADQKQAKINGLKPAHFSFNIDGGRCEECQGEGFITVEMQFMADVFIECESCKGKRFKDEIIDIKFHNKNIHDILEMTIAEAVDFFENHGDATGKRINNLLKHYIDVGLDYLKMGQSSSTFSGGENQRVKLATFLSHEKANPSIFIFDEPTTGLHFHDIKNLLTAMAKLRHNGHTIIIIEHNLEVIKNADWVIDLGPEGGENGGNIIFEGTPEDLIHCKESYTGKYLKTRLE